MFDKTRQQFSTVWQRQTTTQRVVLAGLFIGSLVLIGLFLRWANTTTYGVAYSNLSEADAGAIVEQLDSLQIPYQLRGAGTILVPSNQVYDVRLRMAREGLPETTNVGFEVFSGNTLGMTEFTQRVNYSSALWKANWSEQSAAWRTLSSSRFISFLRTRPAGGGSGAHNRFSHDQGQAGRKPGFFASARHHPPDSQQR